MQEMIIAECDIIADVMEGRSFTILIDDFGYDDPNIIPKYHWIVEKVRSAWSNAIITREDGCGDLRGGYRTMPGFVLAIRIENV